MGTEHMHVKDEQGGPVPTPLSSLTPGKKLDHEACSVQGGSVTAVSCRFRVWLSLGLTHPPGPITLVFGSALLAACPPPAPAGLSSPGDAAPQGARRMSLATSVALAAQGDPVRSLSLIQEQSTREPQTRAAVLQRRSAVTSQPS